MKRSKLIKLCWTGAIVCAVVLALLLSGCSNFSSVQPVMRDNVMTIVVTEAPDLPKGVLGMAKQSGGMCFIYLRKYPTCIGHEVMHCLSGHWHGTTPNGEYCD